MNHHRPPNTKSFPSLVSTFLSSSPVALVVNRTLTHSNFFLRKWALKDHQSSVSLHLRLYSYFDSNWLEFQCCRSSVWGFPKFFLGFFSYDLVHLFFYFCIYWKFCWILSLWRSVLFIVFLFVNFFGLIMAYYLTKFVIYTLIVEWFCHILKKVMCV